MDVQLCWLDFVILLVFFAENTQKMWTRNERKNIVKMHTVGQVVRRKKALKLNKTYDVYEKESLQCEILWMNSI